MAKLAIYNMKGKEVGSITLPKETFEGRVNDRVLYQVINCYQASQHRGTAKTKKRDEIRGGGKKPWKQKGTGRARSGSIRNPLWRGGGTVFGPQVRSFAYSVPRKARRKALIEAFKSKVVDEDITVIDSILIDKPKTSVVSSLIKTLKLGKKVLMVVENVDSNMRLASGNIPKFMLKRRIDLNALDILSHNKMAISEEALKNIVKEYKS